MNYSKLCNTYTFKHDFTENYEPKDLFYLHIPKTGGTLIENMFFHHKIGAFTEPRKWDLLEVDSKIIQSKWHIPPRHINNLDFRKVIPFTSIREPIDRIISEYTWEPESNTEINTWIINAINKHKLDEKIYDYHLEPQVSYIKDKFGNKMPYENIILCDSKNFVNNIVKFAKKYNIRIIDYEKSIPSKTSLPHPIHKTPQYLNTRHTNKQDYSKLRDKLTPYTINYIKNYYKEDFKLYEMVKLYN
jgi:hypothetical protein